MTATPKEAIVELKNVSFSYGAMPVLEDITMTIRRNDFLGIIGPNGGGKTTALRLILGLARPDTGTVTVFGKPPAEGRRTIGYIPQLFEPDLDFPLTVLDIVLMGRLARRGLFKRYTRDDTAAALEALERVGMRDRRDRRIGDLSGGERQRVLIARALTTEPQLLLLDEPVSSIDTKWQNSFYSLLKDLNSDMTIVMVTHDIGVLSAYVEQVACLNRRLHYHGSTQEGIRHLADTYECPIELIAHGIPHRVLEDHE
ncbi:MAG TPA: metal ABC transporter ATP-binding protein [Patescibacteria group bacterium]|nr:metal ABC transporter ATP-binding protein [Patescibacteria group bacterium]